MKLTAATVMPMAQESTDTRMTTSITRVRHFNPDLWDSPVDSQRLIGRFQERDMPEYASRNFEERGFTVGIGGYANGA